MTFLRYATRKRKSLWKQREDVDEKGRRHEKGRRDEKRDGMGEEMKCFDSSSLPSCLWCLWCLWQLDAVPTSFFGKSA
jgi:hypothetical protein